MHQPQDRVEIRFVHMVLLKVSIVSKDRIHLSAISKVFEIETHECKHLIILKTPNVLLSCDTITRHMIWSKFVQVIVKYTNILISRPPWQLYKKIGFENCRDTYRLSILRLSQNTDQVFIILISSFPSQGLEYHHMFILSQNFNIIY